MARILPNNYRQLGDEWAEPRGSYWHLADITAAPVGRPLSRVKQTSWF